MSADKAAPTYTQFTCIGAGFAGIGLGATLQRWCGITDVRILERASSLGGTWWAAKYPGAACDVPSALYSFSFESNPEWSRLLPSQAELWNYLYRVAEKYDLLDRMTFGAEVVSCEWIEERARWLITYRDVTTRQEYLHESQFLFGGTGQLVTPRELDVAGAENFKGPIFHSAKWREDVDLTDKKIIVIGNGCTGNQIVPAIVKKVKHVTHLVRSKHWILPPIDRETGSGASSLLKTFPILMKLMRFAVFCIAENAFRGFAMTAAGQKFRDRQRRVAEGYMRKAAPKEYHDDLIPDFEVGCKRRIFDSGYLRALHEHNIDLVMDTAVEVVPKGIRTKDHGLIEADVIVLANGYKTNFFTGGVDIIGRGGKTLKEHWEQFGGPEAYISTVVNGFPNFFMVAGPNSATGHTSGVMAIENSINYGLRVIKPILDGKASICDIRSEAENAYVEKLQQDLHKTVWFSGCASWYIRGTDGKKWNSMSYPYSQPYFWYKCLFPVWRDWEYTGRAKKGYKHGSSGISRVLLVASVVTVAGLAWTMKPGASQDSQDLLSMASSSFESLKTVALARFHGSTS